MAVQSSAVATEPWKHGVVLDPHATAGVIPRRGLQYYVFYRVASRQRVRYRPADTFGGPTLIARASANASDELGADLGWGPFLRGPRSLVGVPGRHYTMIHRPNVAALASELRRALDAAS
jgi:thioesterase domain-containing protein